jgi:hypothetical protein
MIRNSESEKAKYLIYFLLDKKQIVYVGESQIGIARIFQHRTDKDFDDYIYISERELPFLKNYYFRRYYERRWIIKFKNPKYNLEKITVPTLNEFLVKMYLWAENPQREWVKPLTRFNNFFVRKLEGKSKRGKIFYTDNQYSKVHSTLDIAKVLYINNELAFKFLANEKPKKSLRERYTRKFNHRKETITN